MYRAFLDLREGQRPACLLDPYLVHQILHTAWPPDGRDGRMLFRIARKSVVVQTLGRPPHPEQWGRGKIPFSPGPIRWYEPALAVGREYRFSLLASPTRTRDGRRFGLLTREEAGWWLGSRQAGLGFQVTRLRTNEPLSRRFQHGSRGTVALAECHFRGTLVCRDAALLYAAVRGGIGTGKAFGYGLLMLSEMKSSG